MNRRGPFKRLGVNVLLDKPFTQEKLVEALKTGFLKQGSEASLPSSDTPSTAWGANNVKPDANTAISLRRFAHRGKQISPRFSRNGAVRIFVLMFNQFGGQLLEKR